MELGLEFSSIADPMQLIFISRLYDPCNNSSSYLNTSFTTNDFILISQDKSEDKVLQGHTLCNWQF